MRAEAAWWRHWVQYLWLQQQNGFVWKDGIGKVFAVVLFQLFAVLLSVFVVVVVVVGMGEQTLLCLEAPWALQHHQ